MGTQPIYELRERLRAVSIAGTGLLSENFRLKRAYEAFQPLEAASPVFAKIGELTAQLVSPDCQKPQAALLDALSLTDAVLCTLGTVDVTGELRSVEMPKTENNTHDLVFNAPYSMLKELTEALTTSGGGHYGYVSDMRKDYPEIFKDYRVKYAMVQALGASYAELADNVEEWLAEDNDKSVLPLLYRDFDPKGKKEMVRRVRVIAALAGADANDFYIQMLEGAQKDIRQALIYALRHDAGNTSLLFDLLKTERGKNKDAVLHVLASMEDGRAREYFSEIVTKNPETVVKCLTDAESSWSSEMVELICGIAIERLNKLVRSSASDKEELEVSCFLYDVIRAMFGKGGACICRCYRKLLEQKEMINNFLYKRSKQNNAYEQLTWQYDILGMISKDAMKKGIEKGLNTVLLQSLVVNPDAELKKLALELNLKDTKFLSAAVMTKFLDDDNDCIGWLKKQTKDKLLVMSKLSFERMAMVFDAASYIRWNEAKCNYECFAVPRTSAVPPIKRDIKLSHSNELIRWLKKYAVKDADEVLSKWVPLNDEQMCKEMGEYFYKKALVVNTGNRRYLDYMKRCGWTECKGLAVHFFKSRQNLVGQWELQEFLKNMPGDNESKRREAETLSEKMKTGEINQGNVIVSGLDEWIDKNL